jgi:hypothetical protein
VRFAIVPESIINTNDPLRIHCYCRIYISLVLHNTINCKAISQETGLSYGIVYRMKKTAEETFYNATTYSKKTKQKQSGKPMKSKRKVSDKSNRYNAENNETRTYVDDNSVVTNDKPVDTRRKQGRYSSRNTGILRLVLEEEKEIEETILLTTEQILELSPSEREVYINSNQKQLKERGII